MQAVNFQAETKDGCGLRAPHLQTPNGYLVCEPLVGFEEMTAMLEQILGKCLLFVSV